MHRILSGLMMLLATTLCHAISEARLISQSSSGRTVIFNLGSLDGMLEGDYAVIVKQIRDLKTKDLRLIPAAKARSIKVSTDSSIWILYYVYDAELLVEGQKFSILTQSNMLRGQRDLKVSKTTLVAPKGEVTKVAKAAVSEDRDRLAKLKEKYQVIARPHDKEFRSDSDFELIDLEEWEKAKGKRYRSALYRSPHKEEFKRSYRLEAFESIVAAYLLRVNDPDFSYETFYEDQMRDGTSNEFRMKGSTPNEYDDFVYLQSQKSTKDAKIYRSILEKGESWSEDFSDEELRTVLKSVSEVQEQDRRAIIVSRPVRYSFSFDYGQILNDSQTDRDPSYRREGLYEVSLDFEVVPFLRHEKLERFTANASARSSKSANDVDGTNVDFDLLSLSLGANWYPFHSPYTIKTPLFFVGTYLRSGFGTYTAPISGVAAKYVITSFPGFRAGLRYLFKNNVGLRIVTSMETLKLERYEVNQLGTGLPESDSLVEGKIAMGLSYSF